MSVAVEGGLPAYGAIARPAGGRGGAIAGTIALALLGVLLAVATYGGREATIIGIFVALAVLGIVVARPQVGILFLTANFLIASYPSPVRGEGLLTINNILGVILTVLFIAQLAQHPDFSFLRVRQIRVLLAIGLVFILGTIAARYQFPDMRATFGTRLRALDQTFQMSQGFITRFAFLILALHFMQQKRDLKRALTVFMLVLVMVVPSALAGYAAGTGEEGNRAAASFSAATNSNRLAFMCLLQIAFWWYFLQNQPHWIRLASYGVIGSLVLTVLLSASRSGGLGLMLLIALLARGRGGGRGARLQVVALVLVALGMIATIVPEESFERMQNLNPFATRKMGGSGSYSTERRVATVEAGWRMFNDYPLFGIGVGNFREVARQVYLDPFYRPPHNSFIWSLTEGGIFCFLLYLLLFWITWRDIRWLQNAPAVPDDLRWISLALEPSLILLLFYSLFADIWLGSVTYILLMLVMILKQYVSSRRVVLA
jgi:O-antigen ligase